MKNFLLFSILLIISQISYAQVTTESTLYTYQIAYCVGTKSATAWIGNDVVLMIEGESPADREEEIMEQIVNAFGDVLNKYKEFTNLNNLPIASLYDGKPVIEVVIDNCGAGGLASHGMMGMSTGTFFLDQFYTNVSQGKMAMPQVFLYELNRNFWMPGFNNKFDWSMNDEIQNYGWWTVGMNNAQAYIVPKSLGIELDYFGSDLDSWHNRMVNEFDSYKNDTQYDFDYGWRQSLMPWHNTESINDLMSGFLMYAYDNFGGDDWIKGFYQQIQSEEIVDRSGMFAYQECRDNVYKIWSLAAQQNLIDFFEDDVRWIITDEAKTFVDNAIETTSIKDISSNNYFYIYPNPAHATLTISINNKIEDNKQAIVYNTLGQLVKSFQISSTETQMDVSDLNRGTYYLQVGAKMQIFVVE